MTFGFMALLAFIGLVLAIVGGVPGVAALGPVYAVLLFIGAVIPCLVIGNYVDDLRRNAVIAQIIYSFFSVAMAAVFLVFWGLEYSWTFPLYDLSVQIAVGNLAVMIAVVETFFALYLIVKWNDVAPPPGIYVERDRGKARQIVESFIPTPLTPSLVSPDGESTLSEDDSRRILEVKRVTTEEGMAVLCSNCGGATPLTKAQDDNTLVCDFCGVTLGLSSVFVPCEIHPEYLAATSCDVCGEHFCRMCLTAQEPPVDQRWHGSIVHICQNCFEGRYRPAVTTTSLVLPIDQLFDQAGSRFSRIGGIYRKFLGKYSAVMKYILEFTLRLAASVMKAGGKGSSNDGAAMVLIAIVVAVVAVPLAIGFLLLLGAVVIIPFLFYAGLVGVTIEAVKIISRTDFLSLSDAREKGVVVGRPATMKESTLREDQRDWEFRGLRQLNESQVSDTYSRRQG
jgi:hypothetical protein